MKQMTKWLLIGFLLTVCACSSDEPDNQIECERVDIDDTEYCTYEQQITETGYDCPQDLPNAIPFEGHTVCSGDEDIPQEHEEPLREHFAGSGESPDAGPNADAGSPTLAELCADPQAYDGRTVTFEGRLIETRSYGTAAGCECCNAVTVDFLLSCGQTDQGNVAPETAIVLVADPDAGFEEVHGVVHDEPGSQLADLIDDSSTDMGCVGQSCYEVCTPAPPEEIVSFTGTFRTGGEFRTNSIIGGSPHSESYNHAVEVADVEVTEQ